MFFKVLNAYNILSFNKEHYPKVTNLIKESYGYTTYINHNKSRGIINPRYDMYLKLKQSAYTSSILSKPPKEPFNSKISMLLSNNIDQEKLNKYIEQNGMQDDYKHNIEINNDDNAAIITHYVELIEEQILDKSKIIDNSIEDIDRRFLSKNFIMKNQKRFTLLPFLAKFGDEYVQPIIIATFYDIGIVTLQISIAYESNKVENLPKNAPQNVILSNVQFYESKKKYKSSDYYNKTTAKTLNLTQIFEYYQNYLKMLCGDYFNDEEFYNYSWVFGDFASNKTSEHKKFIEQNKHLYYSYLRNSPSQLTLRMEEEKITKEIEDAQVFNMKGLHFYCTPYSSILSIGYTLFKDAVDKSVKHIEKELKQENEYENYVNELYKEYTLTQMYQYLRFYELTFIKRYYTSKLLKDILLGTKNLKNFNRLKEDFNFVKLKFDEELILQSDGSPKELYKIILEKTGVNSLVTKCEKLLNDIRENINTNRETGIKNTELFVLILSTILTVTLGYTGIKLIVNDVLSNLPFLGKYISEHPLRYTVYIWFALVLSMIILNVLRIKAYKK
ncbi:hypothetical protein ACFVR2_17620 [Gottfriedia sp. NPDC057991]|uniref:hypothetical protein n=1 Tax=Gottfriedia sp. NPDC057991 TaxID=3346298 RepID=UPI0036DB3F7E